MIREGAALSIQHSAKEKLSCEASYSEAELQYGGIDGFAECYTCIARIIEC